MPVSGVRKGSLVSIVHGSNLQCYLGKVNIYYTLSKTGSIPPVSSSDPAVVPVLSLALFYCRAAMEAIYMR